MRLYTKEHLWLDFEDGIVVLGLTSYAISQLGEITFLTFQASDLLNADDSIACVESVKIAWEIRSPISGKLLTVNRELESSQDKLNHSSENDGWLCQIITPELQAADWMSPAAYQRYLETL